jgi:hypothetical protein
MLGNQSLNKYVDKPVEIFVEKKSKKADKPILPTYTIYEKRGKYICGKCHSDKINTYPKAPKNIEKNVGYYCDGCNTYFDKFNIKQQPTKGLPQGWRT